MIGVENGGFRRVAYEAAEAIVGYRVPGAAQLDSWVERANEKFWPFVQWLTQPRSISDFQKLKRGLLELAAGGKLGPKTYLLEPIFPNFEELYQVASGEMTVGKAWNIFEEPEKEKPVWNHREKIMTVEGATRLIGVTKNDEARAGYVAGKWGLGAHREHLDLLSQAKTALGAGGKLVVGIESERAIIARVRIIMSCLMTKSDCVDWRRWKWWMQPS